MGVCGCENIRALSCFSGVLPVKYLRKLKWESDDDAADNRVLSGVRRFSSSSHLV